MDVGAGGAWVVVSVTVGAVCGDARCGRDGRFVAWGIARAAELSKKIGLCTENYVQTVKSALSSFGWETQPMHSSLNGKFASEKEAALSLFEAMKKDKKN